MTFGNGVQVTAAIPVGAESILTPDALAFVGDLHRRFNLTRQTLLEQRKERQQTLARGGKLDFLEETKGIREGEWMVASAPSALDDRRVEITGPTDRKMMINALNSRAKVFMADFEDALSPTWENVTLGQVNLREAVLRTISFEQEDGKRYELGETLATLVVRPRGWHLPERHVLSDGEPVSASLFDFGLAFFHNAAEQLQRGAGPYFYLPKTESRLEARLWNDVFTYAQGCLGVPHGSIRATVLIETIFAAFEMEEILYELREHAAGLNAGRWDYIFSLIKAFRDVPTKILPDRADVTMAVPFMRAYTDLLVKTCHARGAHAIGGMAAFIPTRRDPQVNAMAFAKVQEDKEREVGAGFDGTWVAHPGLVPVATEVFDKVLGDQPNQKGKQRPDVTADADALVNTAIKGAAITAAGLHTNVSVALQYLESWLSGVGAAAINNLMEDAATAEISRAQIWQWIRHGATTEDGVPVSRERFASLLDAEVGKFGASKGRFWDAAKILSDIVLADEFVPFMTLRAYDYLD